MKPMTFETVRHDEQRYPTVGDYQESPSLIKFRISKMNNWKYEVLVAVHELVEKILVNAHGVDEAAIDAFDIHYEENRCAGDVTEPGDDVRAPYYKEHQFATRIEKMLCAELGIPWDQYNSAVEAL